MTIPGACDCCTDCTGELIFPGDGSPPYPFTMNRAAWCLTDLSDLWEMPNQRGENILIPGAAGKLPQPRRPDETDYALPFIVSGVVDPSGNATTIGENAQLRVNLAWLAQYVLDPQTPPLSTIVAHLKSPDGGTTLVADVQFGSQGSPPLITRKKASGLWIGTLHMVIPAGSFA